MMLFSKALIVLFLVWGTVTVKQFAFFAYQRKPLDSLRLGDKLYNYNDCPYALRVAASYINYQQENESYPDNINNNDRILSDENIELFDLTGRKVNIYLNKDKNEIKNLQPGIYIYRARNNDTVIKKLIIK